MCGTQLTLVIVAPQAFKNGLEVLKPILIAHAKDHSDVDQMLTRNQIMVYASKENYDLCVDSAHIDSLLPLLQGMQYVNHNSGICLLVIKNDCPGMFSPMETTTSPDVTYTAGCQMNCATLGIRIAKFFLVH